MSYFKKNMQKKNLRPAKQYLNEIWPVSQKSLATPGIWNFLQKKKHLQNLMKVCIKTKSFVCLIAFSDRNFKNLFELLILSKNEDVYLPDSSPKQSQCYERRVKLDSKLLEPTGCKPLMKKFSHPNIFLGAIQIIRETLGGGRGVNPYVMCHFLF
jgi:hypothetical protein